MKRPVQKSASLPFSLSSFSLSEEAYQRRVQKPTYYYLANSIYSPTEKKIPFNSELIRSVPIFLFISTYRVLISDRLHNTAAQFNARRFHARSLILLESMVEHFSSFHPAPKSPPRPSVRAHTIFNQQLPSPPPPS